MSGPAQHSEYTEDFITALQWMWGDGYLSPGGGREVAEMLRGVDVGGKEVLDVGCGLGAIDLLLCGEYGASSVVGIDVEPLLVEHARRRVALAGMEDRIEIRRVEPGPLPFADGSFDVVFSKDSIIHIPDKAALYGEVLRVLRPAGMFVGSDWLRGGSGPYSAEMREWLDLVQLTFEMKNLDQTRDAMVTAGFTGVRLTDRNDWYREEIRNELDSLRGARLGELARRIGGAKADHRLRSSTSKQKVVERGELRPTHFAGRKPV